MSKKVAHPKDLRVRRERLKQPFSREEMVRAYTRYLAFHLCAYQRYSPERIVKHLQECGYKHVTAPKVRRWLSTENLPLL
jgi:hypothetical protein